MVFKSSLFLINADINNSVIIFHPCVNIFPLYHKSLIFSFLSTIYWPILSGPCANLSMDNDMILVLGSMPLISIFFNFLLGLLCRRRSSSTVIQASSARIKTWSLLVQKARPSDHAKAGRCPASLVTSFHEAEAAVPEVFQGSISLTSAALRMVNIEQKAYNSYRQNRRKGCAVQCTVGDSTSWSVPDQSHSYMEHGRTSRSLAYLNADRRPGTWIFNRFIAPGSQKLDMVMLAPTRVRPVSPDRRLLFQILIQLQDADCLFNNNFPSGLKDFFDIRSQTAQCRSSSSSRLHGILPAGSYRAS